MLFMANRFMFVTSGGVRIHYESEGTGPAIIMHTGAGGDLRMWRDAGYVAGLSKHRKILMDQRGRGKSDRPSAVDSHRLDWYVKDICAVLDDAAIETAAFCGYSAGAVVGVAFGTANPKRIQALVGIGSLPYVNFADLPKPPDPEAEIQRTVAAGGVRAEYADVMKRDKDKFPEAIHRNVMETDPMMNALDDLAWLEWKGPLDSYPTFCAPVLMIAGEREDSKRQTEKSIAVIPNGRLVRLPGMGHLSAFYRSDVTLPHILPFLRENLL